MGFQASVLIRFGCLFSLLFSAQTAWAKGPKLREYAYHQELKKLLDKGDTVHLGIIVDKVSTTFKKSHSGWKDGIYQSVYSETHRRILQSSGFAQFPNFVLVDRGGIEAVLQELNFQQTGYLTPKDQTKIGELLGLTHILFVSFSRFQVPDPYAFMDQKDFRLVEIKTGRVLSVDTITCYGIKGTNEYTPWEFKGPKKKRSL